ncbi:MAG TPA: isoprenylcysteine carboxylmethyltransferase family protein [Rhizobiaceae bacterium]|nr:isoprenylcysteine carboxylmethyltransferase family protein [Rhizobiaceae bacterium]
MEHDLQGSTLVAMTKDAGGQQTVDAGTAGVVARPPLLFLGALLIGGVLDRLLPLPIAVPGGDLIRWTMAGALIAIGLALVVAGIRNFLGAGTPVPTNEPTRALVTAGIHGWTRNPIYVGFFLIYVGIGVGVQGVWILLLTIPLAITVRYGVVAREEAYLESRFGEAYRAYKARVRRWL